MSLNTILATTPLTSTGYHLKATGTTIGNSLIYDNGTNVGIGNTNTSYKLEVTGTLGVSGAATFISAAGITNGNGLNLRAGGNSASDANVLNFTSLAGTINVSMFSDASSSNTRLKSLGNLSFHTGNIAISADNERMTIGSGGSIGMGTTNLIYAALNIKASGAALYNGIALYSTNGTETFLGIGNSGTECGLYATYGANGSYIPITFSTGGSERMRITSGGQVYIGVTANAAGGALALAQSGLVIYATTGQYRQLSMSGNVLGFFNGSNEATLTNAGVWTDASDISIKKDIIDIKYGLNEVMKLKPKSYKMIEDDLEQIGFIAQDVEEILPELVSTSHRGMKGLSYGQITAVLTKAIQEMNTKLDEQNQTIQNLQEQINILAK